MAVNNPLLASQSDLGHDNEIIEQVEQTARELHPKDDSSRLQRVEDHEGIMRSR